MAVAAGQAGPRQSDRLHECGQAKEATYFWRAGTLVSEEIQDFRCKFSRKITHTHLLTALASSREVADNVAVKRGALGVGANVFYALSHIRYS